MSELLCGGDRNGTPEQPNLRGPLEPRTGSSVIANTSGAVSSAYLLGGLGIVLIFLLPPTALHSDIRHSDPII